MYFRCKNAHIFCQALLDEKGGCLSKAERKARKRLFQAVQNGDFSDLEDIGPASKYIPHLCLIKLSPYKYQDARGIRTSLHTFGISGTETAPKRPSTSELEFKHV
jgi:hypothetical protein